MGDALQSLEDQYIFLTNNLSAYLDACQSQAQKDIVLSSYVNCRRNYWNSIDQTFHNDDPNVASAVKQMAAAQDSLKDSLAKLNEIASVLNVITSAVKVGAQLAGMVE